MRLVFGLVKHGERINTLEDKLIYWPTELVVVVKESMNKIAKVSFIRYLLALCVFSASITLPLEATE